MSTSDKLTIKLVIGESNYPLTIERQDEPLYREAAKRVNDILGRYKQKYPGREAVEYFAMTAFHAEFLQMLMKDNKDTQPYQDMMDRVQSLFDDL
ncbi:MAG: cell division protein ZapA [Bacteroidaceae bacterium]|nr:cell division protein ZapA [Bacteroidaceae bacterium]